jgi:hypothetical protein
MRTQNLGTLMYSLPVPVSLRLQCGSKAARLLGLRIRVPFRTSMFVSCVVRGLCREQTLRRVCLYNYLEQKPL